MDNIRKLKESLVEAYTCITFNASEGGSTTIFNAHMKNIFAYLERLSVQSAHDFEILRQIAGLIGDLIKLYGKKIQEIPNLNFVKPLLDVLSRSTQTECKRAVAWCQKAISEIKTN